MSIDPGPGFSPADVGGRPAWRHEPSGVVFRHVPGGTFVMGLSEAEHATLRALAARGAGDEGLAEAIEQVGAMRPVRRVTVGPVLMARHPLSVRQLQHWLPGYEDDYAEDLETGEYDEDAVARVDEEQLAEVLAALPFRLPSEAEWEYAARAGTTGLTYRGDGIGAEADLLATFADEARVLGAENPFGLSAMGSAFELCADAYRPDYVGAPSDAAPVAGGDSRVVRGGAADMSPWQACNEWLAMLSAARAPFDMFAAIRPVVTVL